MNYLIFGLSLVLFVGLYFIFKKFVDKNSVIISKVVSVTLFALFFVWTFSSKNNLLSGVVKLETNNPFASKFTCGFTAFVLWMSFASLVLLQLTPFFKYEVLKNYSKTFCLVVSVLTAISLNNIAYVYSGSYGVTFTSVFLSIQVALSLAFSVYILAKNKWFKIGKKELLNMLWLLPIVVVFSIPPYLPKLFIGNVGQLLCKGLALYHRIYIYLAFAFLFILFFALKNKEPEFRRMVLLYISLVALIAYVYNDDFTDFITPTSWPLHLCNTAMFIIPICLIFKWEKLFYFTLFINVLGAFFAMLMPNYSDTSLVLSNGILRFWINHIMAFSMPIVIVLLDVYPKPKLKQFIYSMIAFLFYFLLVLIVNAWLTNIDPDIDFFFINSDFIAVKAGKWAENLRNITATIYIKDYKLIFYPVYQALFFGVYIILGLAMWFLYAYIFQIQDFYTVLNEKKKKIKLDELALCVKYGKKEINNCMNKESVNKLVVHNASKKYGTSDVYSLNNASFEVKGGEVLGFLGPNGAGKSTLIKSIVGIQPLTSGSIEINGYDIEKQPVMAKQQLGFVPDHYALYEKLTGREYLNYIADLYEVKKEDRDQRIEELITNLQMKNSIDNPIKTYSHGMKQKIAIMSALVHKPKLWILDEPLTGLDPTSIYQVKECMKKHAEEGNIVFFSSHLIDIVEKLCDRIIIIKKGEIQTEAVVDKLKDKDIDLEEFYLNTIGDTTTQTEEKQEEKPEIEKKKRDKNKKKKLARG